MAVNVETGNTGCGVMTLLLKKLKATNLSQCMASLMGEFFDILFSYKPLEHYHSIGIYIYYLLYVQAIILRELILK